MVIRRGEIYWVNVGTPRGSAPAKRRPVLVVQTNPYNDSLLATVIVAVISTNTQLADHPGNVFVPAAASGLRKDSAINVSQLVTIDKALLEEKVSDLPRYLVADVGEGLHGVLGH